MNTRSVLVGLDDSAAAATAHRWAAAYAAAVGTTVRAVHVLEWPVGLRGMTGKSGTRLQVSEHEVAEAYWRGIHRVFEDVTSPPGSVLQCAQGDIAEVLVRLSRQADLLVLGNQQAVRTHLYLTGSISRYCISHAACPVVIVPQPVAVHAADAAWADGNATSSVSPIRARPEHLPSAGSRRRGSLVHGDRQLLGP